MCWWLTVGTTDAGAAIARLRAAGLHVAPAGGAAVAAAFPSGLALLDVTHGGCSCDLRVGGSASDGDALASLRARYERRGWKASKIERALKSARLPSERAANPRAQALVAALAQLSAEQPVFLFYRAVSGALSAEVPKVAASARLARADYVAARGAVPEDTTIALVD